MPESVIQFRDDEKCLFGILHTPATSLPANGVLVVFLHGWSGYRIGPHQMFVKHARRLSQQGYHCLRFDFRGRGFSSGDRDDTTDQTMRDDLQTVLDAVRRDYAPRHLVLLGICSGARLALSYVKQGPTPIDHVIALSFPAPPGPPQVQLEAKRTGAMLGAYWRKLFQSNTWAKLGAGQLNTGLILRNLGQPVRNLHLALKRLLVGSRTPAPARSNGKAPGPARPFAGFGGEVLLIHGEKDPETGIATARLNAFFERYRVAHQCVIIRGANHSFYSLAWENEIYGRIEAWLEGKYPSPGFPLPAPASIDAHSTGSGPASNPTASPALATGGA